ncbi:MAG: winged helix-turn-helix transcriptional regulator [Lachnospiraceae bacterium]|nr:winged helix-turn-helix transcriptional regulator [Lachnospiraceae bacterium]
MNESTAVSLVLTDTEAEEIRHGIPEESTLDLTANLFKVFGDATRIRILYALMESEICVNDLATILDMTQSAISHQLRILKQNKLVKARRDGKLVYYALDDDHVRFILQQGMDHVMEN